MSTVDLPAVKPHCDSGLNCGARLCKRVKVTRAKTLPNDAQKRDAAIVVAITTVTLVLVQGDYVGISHVCHLSSLPAQAEELMKRLQDVLLPISRVELEIMLHPTLQLHALISDDIASL